jgi:hypothetical protein
MGRGSLQLAGTQALLAAEAILMKPTICEEMSAAWGATNDFLETTVLR